MKILICCDSFKGSLSAKEVCRALENGIKKVLPDAQTVCFPLADGGEGTVECFHINCGGRVVSAETVNCFFEPVKAAYLMTDSKTAVIETAAASGIMNVPAEKLNPMKASTYGTGLLIKDAVKNGAGNIILGLGGSATNDGGTGALSALGVDFLDGNGEVLAPTGENLIKITDFKIRSDFKAVSEVKFSLACDVENVFYGETGAAFVFARQKGANDGQIKELDRGLENLAGVIERKLHINPQKIKGAGAAGGLAGGLLPFLDCEIKSGFSVLSEASSFENRVKNADIVITGEGKTDAQTAYGKLPARVGVLAGKYRKPCILVCGQLDGAVNIKEMGFSAVFTLTDGNVSAEEAIKNASQYLSEKGRAIAERLK